MRRGYTLIEIIITVAITGILSVGMFKAFEAIALRSEKAKILTTLSIDSQSALDQISLLLYNRAPMSTVGFNKDDIVPPHDQLQDATNATILQWYGTASESYQAGDYSGFVDMNASDKNTYTLYSPNTYFNRIRTTQINKWGTFNWDNDDVALIFAGSFEDGDRIEPYIIKMTQDNNISFYTADKPTKIYEKYYLVDTAYAVTRKGDVATLSCTNVPNTLNDNALLLFHDYRPWNGENFCTHGKVSILSLNVNGFSAHIVNATIRLGIDMNRTVRGGNPVRLSKQKVVF